MGDSPEASGCVGRQRQLEPRAQALSRRAAGRGRIGKWQITEGPARPDYGARSTGSTAGSSQDVRFSDQAGDSV